MSLPAFGVLWYVVWDPLGPHRADHIAKIFSCPIYDYSRPLHSPMPPMRHPQDSPESIQKRLLFLPDPACVPHRGHEIMGIHRYREGSCKGLTARLRRSKSTEWCLIMPSGGYRCAQKWADPPKSGEIPMFHNHENYKG